MRLIAALMLVVALCGFGSCQHKPTAPEVVKVPVRITVPVPEPLTEPCPIARAERRTVEAVIQAYNANVEHLEACNRKLSEIRALPVGDAP